MIIVKTTLRQKSNVQKKKHYFVFVIFNFPPGGKPVKCDLTSTTAIRICQRTELNITLGSAEILY